MRDEYGITDIFVGKLRDLLSRIEKEFPGVRLIAVDTVEDEIVFGEAYVDEQDAVVSSAIKNGEMKISKDGIAYVSSLRT